MSETNKQPPTKGGVKPQKLEVAQPRPVTRGLLQSRVFQLVLGVFDESGSMELENRAEDATAGARSCATELASSKNRGAFHVGVVGFGERADVVIPPTPAGDIDPQKLAVVVRRHGEYTNFTVALEKALEVVQKHKTAPGTWSTPVVVLFSDGGHNHSSNPEIAASRLKAEATLVCAGLGASADMGLLSKLATSPAHAVACPTGADLRRFFAQVGATVSQAALTGQAAVSLLGTSLLTK